MEAVSVAEREVIVKPRSRDERNLFIVGRHYALQVGESQPQVQTPVGDGSKVENRDGLKVNWDNLHGKMSEDFGPYKIGTLFKDPEF
jgi:hypothetical protein